MLNIFECLIFYQELTNWQKLFKVKWMTLNNVYTEHCIHVGPIANWNVIPVIKKIILGPTKVFHNIMNMKCKTNDVSVI